MHATRIHLGESFKKLIAPLKKGEKTVVGAVLFSEARISRLTVQPICIPKYKKRKKSIFTHHGHPSAEK